MNAKEREEIIVLAIKELNKNFSGNEFENRNKIIGTSAGIFSKVLESYSKQEPRDKVPTEQDMKPEDIIFKIVGLEGHLKSQDGLYEDVIKVMESYATERAIPPKSISDEEAEEFLTMKGLWNYAANIKLSRESLQEMLDEYASTTTKEGWISVEDKLSQKSGMITYKDRNIYGIEGLKIKEIQPSP